MANYITRPAIDRRAGKTDIEQLMPYLKNELETVRNNDNAKIATLQKMEANALANPDAYRGTKFHISNDGFVNMNEKAKGLMRPKDGIDYSQDAINESSDIIDRELTDQLTTDAINKIANTEERKTAAADAKNIGQLDKARLAQLALDGKDSQGNDLLKDIAVPTPPTTQQTEGAIATSTNISTNTPTSIDAAVDKYASGGTGTDPFASSLGGTAKPDAYDSAFSNLQNGTTSPQPATGTITTSTQPDPNVLKTGTAAEKANELAKQNPGMGGKAIDKNAASKGSGMGRNWTVTTDIGVGKSNIKTDAVHNIATRQQTGIIDQDAVDLKSLKVAAGLEDILNSAKAGRPGSVPMTAMANRLAQREAFLTDIQNKRGVVTSTKQTGGNVDAGLGEMNAKFTSKTGVDSYTNISNSTSSTGAVQVDKSGNGGVDDDGGVLASIGDRDMLSEKTGTKTPGGEPIFKFTTPTDFTGGYDSSNIGNMLSNSPGKNWNEKNANFIKAMKNEHGMTATYQNGDWHFSDGQGQSAILYKNGKVSGNLTAGMAQALFGDSSRKSAANNARVEKETKVGANGVEKKAVKK